MSDLKPCPFCGNENPFEYISPFVAVLKCKCGAEAGHKNSAIVLYKKGECPPELVGVETYEPTALSIRQPDGSLLAYPDHELLGVSAIKALNAYGCIEAWNTRHVTPEEKLRDEKAKAYGFLLELYAQVKGECAWLLDEDRGGDAELACSIEALIKRIEQLKKEHGV